MFKYIIKRLLIAIGVLFGVSIIIFALIHMQPGNPYSTMVDSRVSKEVIKEMLTKVGYYDPLPMKYIKWITRTLHGDFGYSIYYGAPVLDVINSRIWNTVLLSAFDLKLLPVSGMKTIGENYNGLEKIIDILKHLILPGVVLAFLQMASFMKYTRASMLEVLNKEYMKTARGKGLSKNKTIWKHGFKNALIPIVTILCLQVPFLFSGALLTETIFVWPGIGRLNYEALLNRDYPLIMGILMIIAIIILLSNLLADILYALIDPRIKYE